MCLVEVSNSTYIQENYGLSAKNGDKHPTNPFVRKCGRPFHKVTSKYNF